jgi:hypothetical protein
MFHCDENIMGIYPSAKKALEKVIREKGIDKTDDVKSILSDLRCATKMLEGDDFLNKGIISERGKEAMDRASQKMIRIEWHLFITSKSKPESWRKSLETAVFLSGLNPISTSPPFTDEYKQPHGLLWEALFKRIRDIKFQVNYIKPETKSESDQRVRDYFDRYIEPVMDEIFISDESWSAFNSIFGHAVSDYQS